MAACECALTARSGGQGLVKPESLCKLSRRELAAAGHAVGCWSCNKLQCTECIGMMRQPAEAFGIAHPELVVDPLAPAALLACLDGRAEAAAKGGEAAARLEGAGVGSWDVACSMFRFHECCLCTRETRQPAASASSSSQQQPAASSSNQGHAGASMQHQQPMLQPCSEVMEEEDGVEDENCEEEEEEEEEEDNISSI